MVRMGMSLRIEIFPANIDGTADFYTAVLGFELVRDERDSDPPYLAFVRDAVQIGAAGRDDVPDRRPRRPPTGVELVLEVDDLDGICRRIQDFGWPIEEQLTARPWGLRDFRILDPNGYYLRITEHGR
jgi:catechol 2,3-dioxygenase-like lactoylglutathione lyase family enzyme